MKGSGPISIRTVAEQAGVSIATVSNVLTGKAGVSPSYVARVRAAADALGYVPDSSASRLRSARPSLAGVVVPDLSNPLFGAFVSTLERLARDDGFDLLVVSADNDAAQEAARLSAIRSWRPAGLIVIPCDGGLSQRLPQAGMPPIVVADRIPDDGAFDLVAVDNAHAAGALTAHLAARGHGSCLVVGSLLSISNVAERWSGALGAAGAMVTTMLQVGVERTAARERFDAHLGDGVLPEAIVALDHITTLVVYQALTDRGLVVGRDIALASFDEAEWMRLVSPPLTAVAQPVAEMAAAAWRQLRRRLDGETGAPQVQRLACSLALRGSTTGARPDAMPSRSPSSLEGPAPCA